MGPFEAFVDDLDQLPPDAILYRRVSWGVIGGERKCAPGAPASLSSNVFADYPEVKAREMRYPGPCMSVALSTVLADRGLGPAAVLVRYPGYGLTRLRAWDLRDLRKADGTPCPQGLMLAPTPEEPWHCVVYDPIERPRKGAVQKAILRVATWEVPLVRTVEGPCT